MQSRHQDCRQHSYTLCLQDCNQNCFQAPLGMLATKSPRYRYQYWLRSWSRISRPQLRSGFRGVQKSPLQRPGTNPSRPYRTPIITYIYKMPPVRRGYCSLFLCSILCTCATWDADTCWIVRVNEVCKRYIRCQGWRRVRGCLCICKVLPNFRDVLLKLV